MKLLIIASLILCLPLLAFGQKARKAFAYDYTIDDLPNGLRLITVPTDYPNLVTKDAEGLRDAILANRLSPITYNSPKPKEITDEDKIIEAYKIIVKPGDIVIVPVDKVFQ